MKILETALIAIVGGAVVVGSYQAGKMRERDWWRQELAARNSAVSATLSKLGTEATDLDAQLLRQIEGDRAKLEDAEAQIRAANAKSPDSIPAADNPCRPVPAQCLLRGGQNSRAQASVAPPGGAGSGR